MNTKTMRYMLFSCSLLCALPCSADDKTEARDRSDIVVHASKVGDDILTDVRFTVVATQKQVWAVLIDYDHMPEFLHHLDESRIIKKSGDTLTVSQHGKVAFGPFSSSYQTIRKIDLVPMRTIRSRVISGNIKKSNGMTTLTSEAGRILVVYHNESTPNINLPFALSRDAIEEQVRQQFQDFRTEVLRRALSG